MTWGIGGEFEGTNPTRRLLWGGGEAHLGVQDLAPVGPSPGTRGGGDTTPGPELGKGAGLVLGITGLVLGITGLVLGILASSWGTRACLLGSQAPGWKMLLEGRGGCGAGAPRWPRGYIHSSSAERRQPGGAGGPRTFVAVREGPGGGPGCPPPALLLGRTLGSAAPFNCG